MPGTARLEAYFQALTSGNRQVFRDLCASVVFRTSEVPDGASAVAHVLDTSAAYTTPGAKLLSLRNATVEKFSVGYDGRITGTCATNVIGLSLNFAGYETFKVDGAGAYIGLNAIGDNAFLAFTNSYVMLTRETHTLALYGYDGIKFGLSSDASTPLAISSAGRLALTQTWNSGLTTFKALTIDITDTASASGSLLMDLMVGGVSKASIGKNGFLRLSPLTSAGNTLTVEKVTGSGGTDFTVDANGTASGYAFSATYGFVAGTHVLGAQSLSGGPALGGYPNLYGVNIVDGYWSVVGARFTNVCTYVSAVSYDNVLTGAIGRNGAAQTWLTVASGVSPTITITGNVGIGTSSSTTLHVNGTVYAESILGTQSSLNVGDLRTMNPVDSYTTQARIYNSDSPGRHILLLAHGIAQTSDKQVLGMTTSWNNGAVTFTALKLNVTDTASASGSLLMDLQVATVSKFSVKKDGRVFISNDILFSNCGLSAGSTTNTGTIWRSLNAAYANNASEAFMASAYLFTSNGNFPATTVLTTDAAGILAQRNGTNAQEFRVYGTYTDSLNYARLSFRLASSIWKIMPDQAGTGGAFPMRIANHSDQAYLQLDNSAGTSLVYATRSIIIDSASINVTGPMVWANETVTTSSPRINLTQTWNNGAVDFIGILADFTSTASGAGSLLLDLRVGGASKFSVSKAGYATFLSAGSGVNTWGIDGGSGLYNAASFGGYGIGTGASDTFLMRDAAGIFAQRNGTNPQGFCVYNTYTNASNYERFQIQWASNEVYVGTTQGGTGLTRNVILFSSAELKMAAGSATRWKINTSGHFLAQDDNTYDIGAAGATRPRNGYFGGTLSFGTHSALGAETVTGYVTITDAAGNSRKLAVVS